MRNILLPLFLTLCLTATASPIDSLLERIDVGASRKIITELDASLGRDCFELTTRKGKPAVRGDCYVSLATGIHWYLKYHAGIDLTWNMPKARLPQSLPLPDKTERHSSRAPLRYYLNYCTLSYSMAFWDWARWEQEIDWMAMHGVNLCLATVGTDAVWREVLRRLGYPASQAKDFIAGPAFHAWWLMNNLEGWGGPESDRLIDRHASLQRKILRRMRQLGIQPVLPGYCGMVPHDARETLGLNVQDPGRWCSYHRPAFLQPTDPRFASVAEAYYAALDSLYGPARYYAMDPFHEGGNSDGVDLRAAGEALWRAMKRDHADATWVVQAWGGNPNPRMMDGVPVGELLVLDLNAENVPQWGDPDSRDCRKDGFGRHDWIFCELLNFGGNTGLFGRIDALTEGYRKALSSTKAATMRGVGLTMEGIGNNEMMYDLMMELPWLADTVTQSAWLDDYARTHYGTGTCAKAKGESAGKARRTTTHGHGGGLPALSPATIALAHPASPNPLSASLDTLAATIYNCPKQSAQQGTTESVFCARPGGEVWQVSSWSNMTPYYDPRSVIGAALLFAKGMDDERLMANDNYRYDLVDILRQALAEKGRLTYKAMQQALGDSDANAFRRASDRFLHLILLQDSLLGTRREFMLGTWISQARKWGATPKEADQMEWNARVQVTTWGNRTAANEGGLHDYAHKEWSGLLRDFYYMRWKTWIDSIAAPKTHELPQKSPDPQATIDWYPLEEAWTVRHNPYPTQPQGDLREIAGRVVQTLEGM